MGMAQNFLTMGTEPDLESWYIFRTRIWIFEKSQIQIQYVWYDVYRMYAKAKACSQRFGGKPEPYWNLRAVL